METQKDLLRQNNYSNYFTPDSFPINSIRKVGQSISCIPMQKNGNGKSDGKENLKKIDSAFSKYTNDDFVQCVA